MNDKAAIAAALSYAVAVFVSIWLGFWWFVAFSSASVVIATIAALREKEYWPAVHPGYSPFYAVPAVLMVMRLIFSHPLEWAQWLGWSAVMAAAITVALTVAWRRHIDREWAVVGTFCLVFCLCSYALASANYRLGGQSCRAELAAVIYSSAGSRGGPRVSVQTRDRAEQLFFVSWETYLAAENGDPVCVLEYSGALGWRWSVLAECTADEVENSL